MSSVAVVVGVVDCSIVANVAVSSLSSAVLETVTLAIEAAAMAAFELASVAIVLVSIVLVSMVSYKRFHDLTVTYAVGSLVQIHVEPTGYPCRHQQSIADLQHPTLLTLAMSTHEIALNVGEMMTLYHLNVPVPAAALNNPTI